MNRQLRFTPERLPKVNERTDRLQGRLDLEAEEFAVDGATFRRRGALTDLSRQATHFMQHAVEQFANVMEELTSAPVSQQTARV